jgi:uncharacterized membrane protein YgcG
MKSSLAVFTFCLVPFAAASAGCAEEYDAREAAYPQQPVGYTQPGQSQEQQAMAQQEAAASQAPDPRAPISEQAPPQASQDVAIGATNDEYSDTDPSALSDFKPTLDPFGTWSEDPTYGTVWTPSTAAVGADFTPYVSAGHWAYDDDYVWESDYSWGWAPFHYGRWVYGGRGWGWIPGRTYAGAWVSWRTGYNDWAYVGWAPLPPLWYWRGGYAYGLGVVPYAPYAFCGSHDLFNPVVAGHLVTGSQVAVVAGNTRPYVPATPTPNGHVGATPRVNGPPPSQLRIPNDAIAHVNAGGDRGLAQARAFSKPATAQALGARPPAQSMAHNSSPSSMPGRAAPGYAGQSARPGAQSGRYGSPSVAQNHATPTYQPPSGYRPSVSSQPHAVPRYQPPAYSQPHASSQTLPRSPGYQPSAPSYSPAPHYNPPSTYYSPPATHYAPPATHYSAPPATHYSAPPATHAAPPSGGSAPHYSAPSGGFHGGGGGGFRGGGGSSRGGGGRR